MNNKMFRWIGAIFFMICLFPSWGISNEEYAKRTGKDCTHCHLDMSGGSELTRAGEDYLEQLQLKEEREQSKVGWAGRTSALRFFRFFLGYLHIITGIFWFGTILYVHLILKPAYAAHGLPKREVKVGLFSMLIMGLTGTFLTLYRIHSFSIFYETKFGILLLIKIVLFFMMVLTALYAVLILGPKLKKSGHGVPRPLKEKFSVDELEYFNGNDDRPAYIAYKNTVYNVSKSDFWKNGIHFERHKAGEDLSEMLRQAPHGEEYILRMPSVGVVDLSKRNKRPAYEAVFYFLAYFNLGLVFLITLILALWRWW